MKKLSIFISLFISLTMLSQEEVHIVSNDIKVFGTLLKPIKKTNKAVLIISGSGATDRNGNTLPNYKNNSLKKIAEELTKQGYATLRYDKIGVGQSKSKSYSIKSLRFEHLANEASSWISYLKKEYNNITVIGHSQGGLVGMLAIQKNKVNQFISLASLTEDAYSTIKRQLKNQPDFVKKDAFPILDSLKNGVKVYTIPKYLNALFNPKSQDYFISFMKYNPKEEIKKITIPTLIVQGNTDLQITVKGATEMSKEAKHSKLVVIDSMNHVLRYSLKDVNKNLATYNNPLLPLHKDLVPNIVSFLEQENKPKATFISETLELKSCESAVYNKTKNIIYASVMGNAEKGDGSIATISIDGKIINKNFVEGLDDPKGISIKENKLYVSDVTELVEVDLTTGKIIKKYTKEDIQFLNDVVMDDKGNVYVSDTFTSKIYKLDINGNFNLWLYDKKLDNPNGLLIRNSTMYVASWGGKPEGGGVSKVDMKTKSVTPISNSIGNLDGIRAYDKDHKIISDWKTGNIHLMDNNGNTTRVLQVGQSVGDIAYIKEHDLLLLPMNKQSRLLFYKLTSK